MHEQLRIAVVSTPRAGNTWMRHLLGAAYRIPHLPRHSLGDADWAALPREVVLQIHMRRTPEFVAKLAEHGFRVVTLARHPLDVLISVLHFCIYESESERWLQGSGGTEAEIRGAMPRSRAFIEYAKGARAAQLLAVTADWWGAPGVLGLRYEDCVRDTDAEVQRVEEAFGPVRCDTRARAVAACSIERLRHGAINNHFWKGSPGLWKKLLPPDEAREIAAAVQPGLHRLGYACEPDPRLDALEADRNWVRLVGDEIQQNLRHSTENHRAQLQERDDRIDELERHCTDLARRLRKSVTLPGPFARAVKWVGYRRATMDPAASGSGVPKSRSRRTSPIS